MGKFSYDDIKLIEKKNGCKIRRIIIYNDKEDTSEVQFLTGPSGCFFTANAEKVKDQLHGNLNPKKGTPIEDIFDGIILSMYEVLVSDVRYR